METKNCVKELREKRGITQEKLAELLGIKVRTIRSWEQENKNRRNPNAVQRAKLCEFFEISEAEFFGGNKPNVIRPEIKEALQDDLAVNALLKVHHVTEKEKRIFIEKFCAMMEEIDVRKLRALSILLHDEKKE